MLTRKAGGKWMANQEHLDILNQGTARWNEWRVRNLEVQPDLYRADLSNANLSRAKLSDADLNDATPRGANLRDADIRGANLSNADLSDATLIDADLSAATVGWTVLGNVDLSVVKGLETVKHQGP